MKCIYCDSTDTKVIESAKIGKRVLRERRCMVCSKHFWTHETYSLDNQYIIKRDLMRARKANRKKAAQEAKG